MMMSVPEIVCLPNGSDVYLIHFTQDIHADT